MRRFVYPLFFLALASPCDAQVPDETIAAFVNNLPARNIGPANLGGRIVDLDIVERNPNIMYVGAATGGVWKTTDAGKTWAAIFDYQGTQGIGAVTIAPSNPDIAGSAPAKRMPAIPDRGARELTNRPMPVRRGSIWA